MCVFVSLQLHFNFFLKCWIFELVKLQVNQLPVLLVFVVQVYVLLPSDLGLSQQKYLVLLWSNVLQIVLFRQNNEKK